MDVSIMCKKIYSWDLGFTDECWKRLSWILCAFENFILSLKEPKLYDRRNVLMSKRNENYYMLKADLYEKFRKKPK